MPPRKRKTDQHLPRGVYRHGRQYRMRIYDAAGKPGWHKLGPDLDTALAAYARILGKQHLGTLATLITRYRRDELPKKATRTQRTQAQQLDRLARVFGHMRPGDIRQADAIAYLEERAKTAPVSGNREIALLRHVLTKCVHWDVIERNPLLGMQYRNKEKARDRIVTDEEMRQAMRRAPARVRYAIWIGYLTGLRREDVLGISRFQCKQDGIHVTEGKTGKRVIIEWSPELRRVVKRLKGIAIDARLFPISDSGFDSAWQRLMRQVEEAGGDRWQFKDLRARHAQDFEDFGGDATRQLGHSSRAVTMRHYLRKPRRVVPLKR